MFDNRHHFLEFHIRVHPNHLRWMNLTHYPKKTPLALLLRRLSRPYILRLPHQGYPSHRLLRDNVKMKSQTLFRKQSHKSDTKLTHRRVHVGAHGRMHVARRRALLILVKGFSQVFAVGHEALHKRHCATSSLYESPTCLYLGFGRVPVLSYVSDSSTV